MNDADKKYILLVEDEETLRGILLRKLERAGYRVHAVGNGAAAITAVREQEPDLVLLDMLLPGVNGFIVLEKMRDEGFLPRVPVVVLSNSGQPVEIQRAMDLGARDHLIKLNFDPEEVLQKVAYILEGEQKKTAEAPQAQAENASASAPASEARAHTQDGAPRVLMVEDDVFLARLLARKLKQEGFTVLLAGDAAQAKRELANGPVDLICLDILLPGENGFSFLEELKDEGVISRTPVLVLSNLGQQEEIDRGLQAGAIDYLIKANMAPGDIIAHIKNILNNKKQ